MNLLAEPPRESDLTLQLNDESWGVFGLQSALNIFSSENLVVDGAFGPATAQGVRIFQGLSNLYVDGVAGPKTQRALALRVCQFVNVNGVPQGVAQSMVEAESGYFFGAVNWKGAGGVDCGLAQRRILGPPFQMADLRDAFFPGRSLRLSLDNVAQRANSFSKDIWARTSRERQVRCALMAHNWPAGAAVIARAGQISSPSEPAPWIPRSSLGVSLVKFPDGELVSTRQEWCEFYAMGGPHGPAKLTKYVTSWV